MRRNLLGAVLCALLVVACVAAHPGPAGAAASKKKPGVPTDVSVTTANTAVVVSWSPPATSGSSPVQGYVVTAVQGKHKPACTMTGATSCLAVGFTNGRAVTIHVRAYNGTGGSGKAAFIQAIPGTTPNCAYVGPWANLQSCSFAYTSLAGDDLTGANLTDVNLHGAHLGQAVLTGADLQYVSSGAIIGTPAALPAGWGVGGGYLVGPGVGLSYVDLSNITFPAASLAGADFVDDDMSGVDLSAVTNAVGADFQYTTLSGAALGGAHLAGADFDDVRALGVTGVPASLPTGWAAVGGALVGPNAALYNSTLSGLTFPSADLTGVNLTSADLSGSDLSAVSSLQGATLSYANLTGSDLAGADLTGATLTGVTWSDTTCPDGSNSDADGGTCIGFGI